MASVGIFFGSDTGNTEAVAKMIQKQLGKQLVHVQDISKSSKEDIDNFEKKIKKATNTNNTCPSKTKLTDALLQC